MISAELSIGRILVARDPGHLQRTRVLMTDAHQERRLTRITRCWQDGGRA
jgi:hypothetical protein